MYDLMLSLKEIWQVAISTFNISVGVVLGFIVAMLALLILFYIFEGGYQLVRKIFKRRG